MVVHHPDGLHEGVANSGADETKAASAKVTAHGLGLGSPGRHLGYGAPAIGAWTGARERPQVGVETTEFLLHGQSRARIFDRRSDLEAVSNDTGIREQSRHRGFVVGGDGRDGEIVERGAVGRPLLENRLPTQAGLSPFENEEFEEQSIVVDGNAPFRIMIRDRQFSLSPAAPLVRVLLHHILPSCGSAAWLLGGQAARLKVAPL